VDERLCSLNPIEGRLLSIDLIDTVKRAASLKETKAELTGIPVRLESLQPNNEYCRFRGPVAGDLV
jgi:hypothetical protein